ncbi:DnaJ-like protein [Kribbella antiqua]|uniref:DnaJ-like protein n=1 Tax=Kribbella antiqua TaxID=2512217 RepID=A0A4R2IQM4_9ACTN|nr:J domain-containing protein [Kribbella antiqua]TCO47671.1 DnaJ-like protein [Kribbella antiqua]
MSGADHYEVLDVERTATTAEIKSAYRRLLLQVHPDQGGNAGLFRLVQEAWATLSDPHKRAAYDATLDGPRSADPTPEPPQDKPDPQPSPDQPGPQASYEQAGPQPSYDEAGPEAANDERPADAPSSETLQRHSPRGFRVVPRFGRWRVAALLTLILWLVLTVGPYVALSRRDGWDITMGACFAALVVVALPPHWQRWVPFHARITGCGVLIALGVVVVTFLPFANAGLSTTSRAWVYAVVGGLVVVRWLGSRWSAVRELDQAIDKWAAYDANVWGRPGEPLVDDGWIAPLAAPDVLRHRRTAHVLEEVLSLPAAKLIHGARVGNLAVAHLVLANHRVAVVSSVVAPGGTYALDAYGSLLRNGQPFDSPGLEAVVNAWHARLKGVEVHGFLIIHSDGPVNIATGGSNQVITCVPAEAAAGELTAWLSPGVVLDRRLLYDILYRAPLDLR